nr:QWRF motif-containing protein 3-like [Tanacetum cinerariifolium]
MGLGSPSFSSLQPPMGSATRGEKNLVHMGLDLIKVLHGHILLAEEKHVQVSICSLAREHLSTIRGQSPHYLSPGD